MTEPLDAFSPKMLPVQSRFSLAARLKSFTYAVRGLRCLVRDEHNARLHLGASLGVIAAGWFLDVSAEDWRWLFLAIALVWLAEAFNTAIEVLCDRIEPGFDEAIGRIKDISAGAVLIASIAAAIIGVLTLWPRIPALPA